jgi:SpoIIAA-like
MRLPFLPAARTWRTDVIKVLEGFPDPIVAVLAEGQVTRQDYEEVLIPRVKQALAKHAKVRLYYELGSAFNGIDAGAAWEDFKIGLEHVTRWERIAVVTDVQWLRLTLGAFRFMMPGKLSVFPTSQTIEARAWIKANQ